MPARSLCKNFLNNILAPLHLYRQKSLIDATNAVINGASLTLTSIGRHLTGTASVKNKGIHHKYQANTVKHRRVISLLKLAENVIRHTHTKQLVT